MIARIAATVPLVPPSPGWEDAEVVDSVLVDEPFSPRRPAVAAGAGAPYDRFGRTPPAQRYGRLVSVLA